MGRPQRKQFITRGWLKWPSSQRTPSDFWLVERVESGSRGRQRQRGTAGAEDVAEVDVVVPAGTAGDRSFPGPWRADGGHA